MKDNPCLICPLYNICSEICEDKINYLYIRKFISEGRYKELMTKRSARIEMAIIIKEIRNQYFVECAKEQKGQE